MSLSLLLAAALIAQAPSEATDLAADTEPLTFGIVDTLTAEARFDNRNNRVGDDNFGLFINRLNIAGTKPGVALSARLDSVVLAETPTISAYQDDVRLERISAELTFGRAILIAGDSYRQLGRGLLLSLRKVDEVGLDVALRGAEARYSPDGHTFSAFAGVVNTANIDNVSARFVEDTGDILAGGSYELSAFDGVNVGLFGLYAQPSERLLDTVDYSISGGANVELPEVIEGLSLYTELAVQSRTLAGGEQLGTGAYVTADWTSGDLTVLVEAMRLDELQQRGTKNTALLSPFDYNQPPTLERLDQEVSRSVDVTGGRVRFELSWLDADLITYANAMLRVNDLGEPAEVMQAHGYLGGEVRFDERLSKVGLSGGYRDERSGSDQIKSMVHFEGDVVKSLSSSFALHVSSSNELRTLQGRGAYQRGSTFLGVEWASHGSLTTEIGYDTQDPSPEVRSFFLAGILAVDVIDAVRLRLNVGTQRGGLKCVAGVCREFPPFAGVRSEIVIRL